MSQVTFNAIFISDLHLGVGVTDTKKLFKFLKEVECKKLFLIGDIIHRRCKDDSSELSEFISILNSKNCEVIYLIGNHELDKKELPPILDGFKIHNYYIYNGIKERIYLHHGHSYDSKDSTLRTLKKIAQKTKIKKRSPKIKIVLKKAIYKAMKLTAQLFLHNSFRNYISLKAKKNRCSSAIAGHFHILNSKKCYDINYYNCGDWIKNCSFIAEDSSGDIKTYKYEK